MGLTSNKGTPYKTTTINTIVGGIGRLWKLIETEEKRESPFDYGQEDLNEFEKATSVVNSSRFWSGKDHDIRLGYHRYLSYLKGEKPSLQDIQEDEKIMSNKQNNYGPNLILYGPPGTGKTYRTVIKAVEIIDGNVANSYNENLLRYRELMKEGRIAFTTFHQSYGYEEFIEGIKPDFEADEIKYKLVNGVFKEFCKRAGEIKQNQSVEQSPIKSNATVWKISLDSAGHNKFEFHDKCLNDGYIRLGWDTNEDLSLVTEGGKVSAKRFIDDMEIGDIVLSCWSQSEIDAIGVITGEYEWR